MNFITNKIEHFKREEIEKAVKHCQKHYPNEAGGIFDGAGLFVPFDNISDKPESCYDIDSSEIYSRIIENDITCFIHSHINQDNFRASYADQIAQREVNLPYGIIHLKNNSCTHVCFFGDDIQMEPLVGRPFVYGIWDCLSLSRDYWKVRYDYELPDPPRKWCFWFKGGNMVDIFPKLTQVKLTEIKEGDFLMYGLQTNTINHLGVMGENGLAIHHFHNCLSQWYPFSYNRKFLQRAYRI